MEPLKIHVILGSTRKNRFSEKPGRYLFEELKKREGIRAELIDLRDWPLPFYDEGGSPNFLKGNFENELGKKWNAKVAEADGFVIIVPEYNHGYPAVLKNAFDWVWGENWKQRPAGFISYGSTLGARSIGQIRQVAIECQLVPIRTSIHIPGDVYGKASKAENVLDPEIWKPLREPVDKVGGFFDQLVWYANALKAARSKG